LRLGQDRLYNYHKPGKRENRVKLAAMAGLPRLKISGLGWDETGETHDIEEARYFPFDSEVTISVDGTVVNSFEELVQLAKQELYRDRDFVEVLFMPVIYGG
jgi:hypothetical protein